jgi:hypothetical protein
MTKFVTRLYDSFDEAEHAVFELERVGVPQTDISLVSHHSGIKEAAASVREPRSYTAAEASGRDGAAGATLGGLLGAGGGALAGLGLIAIPGIGPVVAAGWLAVAAAGALVGGAVGGSVGSITGALTNAGVSQDEADVYAEGVRRGGTLVSAEVADDKVEAAEAALDRFGSVNIGERRLAYHNAGWTHFDDEASPYSDDEITSERSARIDRR